MLTSFKSIKLTTSLRSGAMRSRASASRIPRPVQRDTAVLVKSHTAARHNKPTDKTADIASQLTSMTISKPKDRALPSNGPSDKQRLSASTRIQERRRAVVAKLGLPTKRVTNHPAKATAPAQRPVPANRPTRTASASVKLTPSTPSRAVHPLLEISPVSDAPLRERGPPHPQGRPRRYVTVIVQQKVPNRPGIVNKGPVWAFTGGISKELWDRPTRIPTRMRDPDIRSGDIRGASSYSHTSEPLKVYCKARPHQREEEVWHGYGPFFNGEGCHCHGEAPHKYYRIRPKLWSTTPAEADKVDADRPRRVHFDETVKVSSFEKWYLDAYGPCEKTTDKATAEDDGCKPDDATIGNDNREVGKSDEFNSTWQALMDEGFPDDED